MNKKHNHTFLSHDHHHNKFVVGMEDLFEAIEYWIKWLRKNAYHNNNVKVNSDGSVEPFNPNQQILDNLPTDLKDVQKFIQNLELAVLTNEAKEEYINKFFQDNFKKGEEEAIVNFLYAIYKNPNILGGHNMAERVYHLMLDKLTNFIARAINTYPLSSGFSSISPNKIKNDKVNIETSTFENFLKQAEKNEKIANSKEFKLLQEVLQEAIEEQNEAQKPANKIQQLSNWLNELNNWGEKLEENNLPLLYAIRAGVLAILAITSVSISNAFFNGVDVEQKPKNQIEFVNQGIDYKTQAVAFIGNFLIFLNAVANHDKTLKSKHPKTAKMAKVGAGFDFLSDVGTGILSFAESLKEGILTATSATIVMIPHVLVDNIVARMAAPQIHKLDKILFRDNDKLKMLRLTASTLLFSTVGAGIVAGLQATPQLINDYFQQPDTENTTQVQKPSNESKPIKASPVVEKKSSTVHLSKDELVSSAIERGLENLEVENSDEIAIKLSAGGFENNADRNLRPNQTVTIILENGGAVKVVIGEYSKTIR